MGCSDLEQWITVSNGSATPGGVLPGSFAMLAQARPQSDFTAWSLMVAQRTNEFGIRVAWRATRARVEVFASTVVSVGSGNLMLALNKVLAQWAEGVA
jgi:hypothetical protein